MNGWNRVKERNKRTDNCFVSLRFSYDISIYRAESSSMDGKYNVVVVVVVVLFLLFYVIRLCPDSQRSM